jgi:hypothetical protein
MCHQNALHLCLTCRLYTARPSLFVNTRTTATKDITKPDGDACNADGTLKEAEEIDGWAHSPSDNQPTLQSKRPANDTDTELESEVDNPRPLKKAKVCEKYYSGNID